MRSAELIERMVWGVLFGTVMLASVNARAASVDIHDDPCPRVLDLAHGQDLLHQPQLNKFDGNQRETRAGIATEMFPQPG